MGCKDPLNPLGGDSLGECGGEPFKYSYKFRSKETVSLAVYNVGYQLCSKGQSWGGRRDHYLIHHITAGEGVYSIEGGGEAYHLRVGDTFLVRPGQKVLYTAHQINPWEYCWVGFYGSDAKMLLERTDFAQGVGVISTDFGDSLKESLMDIVRSRGDREQDLVRMTGYLYITLSLLMDKSTVHGESVETSLYYAQKAGEYISERYMEPLTVEDLAARIGVSRSYLFRLFQDHYGLSPKEYITGVRMKVAKQLLLETTLPVGRIGGAVGYEDNLYFSSVFRKTVGVTPTEYRKKEEK